MFYQITKFIFVVRLESKTCSCLFLQRSFVFQCEQQANQSRTIGGHHILIWSMVLYSFMTVTSFKILLKDIFSCLVRNITVLSSNILLCSSTFCTCVVMGLVVISYTVTSSLDDKPIPDSEDATGSVESYNKSNIS